MDYAALKSELITDPLGRGYSGMTDAEAATDLNTAYRSRTVTVVGGGSVLNATDDAEFGALTDEQKSRWLALCGIEKINVSSGVAKSLEADLFGPGTATRTALLVLKNESISRVEELNLPRIQEPDVNYARNIA